MLYAFYSFANYLNPLIFFNVNFPVNIINLGSSSISPCDSAKNLSVIFKTDISMDKHILSII